MRRRPFDGLEVGYFNNTGKRRLHPIASDICPRTLHSERSSEDMARGALGRSPRLPPAACSARLAASCVTLKPDGRCSTRYWNVKCVVLDANVFLRSSFVPSCSALLSGYVPGPFGVAKDVMLEGPTQSSGGASNGGARREGIWQRAAARVTYSVGWMKSAINARAVELRGTVPMWHATSE
jgi:hypothetical protein